MIHAFKRNLFMRCSRGTRGIFWDFHGKLLPHCQISISSGIGGGSTHTHTHTHKQPFVHCSSRCRRHTALSLLPYSFDPGSLKDLLHQELWFRNGRFLKWTRQNRVNQSMNRSISLRLLLLLSACHKRKTYSVFIFFQCRTRKDPSAKHQPFNDEKAIGFVLTPRSKMGLDACLLEHVGRICCGREWHIPSYW